MYIYIYIYIYQDLVGVEVKGGEGGGKEEEGVSLGLNAVFPE